jgi:hypothetical protein
MRWPPVRQMAWMSSCWGGVRAGGLQLTGAGYWLWMLAELSPSRAEEPQCGRCSDVAGDSLTDAADSGH